MCREEFIQVAVTSGYASKRTAENFAGDRVEFSEADLQEVWRIYERKLEAEENELTKCRTFGAASPYYRLGYSKLSDLAVSW